MFNILILYPRVGIYLIGIGTGRYPVGVKELEELSGIGRGAEPRDNNCKLFNQSFNITMTLDSKKNSEA